MLIDTHCHIHDRGTYDFALGRQQISQKMLRRWSELPRERADFEPSKIITRAHENGVGQMICVSTSREDAVVAAEFAKKYKDEGVFFSYGIHPDEAGDNVAGALNAAEMAREEMGSTRAIGAGSDAVEFDRAITAAGGMMPVAIGEVGLDYREIRDDLLTAEAKSKRAAQIRLLERMLQLATDRELPVIFHVRDAFSDFLAVMKNFPQITGVVHSFSDNKENLEKVLESGYYIGVNGLVTFAPEIPLPPIERMLLETDAPFLTPKPFRGTINEPAHVKDICAYLSGALKIPEIEIEGRTTENARRLFRLPDAGV